MKKKCYVCKKVLPLNLFYTNGCRGDGYMSRCKKCDCSLVAKRRRKRRDKIQEFKNNKKCHDCKTKYPHYVSDFHHIEPDGKNFGISKNRGRHSWNVVLEEIKKCTLLCANCHRIRHYEKNK